MTVAAVDRRARNKARTREALRASARRLFAEYGYAATTVEQIAEAAEVSPRTFFRYFSAKEDLLLPDFLEMFADIGRVIETRPIDEHPLDTAFVAVRTVFTANAGTGTISSLTPELDPNDDRFRTRMSKVFIGCEGELGAILGRRVQAARPELDPDRAALHGIVSAHIAIAAARAALRVARQQLADGRGPDLPALFADAYAIARLGCALPD